MILFSLQSADRRATARTTNFVEPCSFQQKKSSSHGVGTMSHPYQHPSKGKGKETFGLTYADMTVGQQKGFKRWKRWKREVKVGNPKKVSLRARPQVLLCQLLPSVHHTGSLGVCVAFASFSENLRLHAFDSPSCSLPRFSIPSHPPLFPYTTDLSTSQPSASFSPGDQRDVQSAILAHLVSSLWLPFPLGLPI